jgi:hypothetical protein
VEEISARLIDRHVHVVAVGGFGHGRHVRIHAHQREAARALGHLVPGQVRIAVGGEAVGVATGELGRDQSPIGKTVTVDAHATLLSWIHSAG